MGEYQNILLLFVLPVPDERTACFLFVPAECAACCKKAYQKLEIVKKSVDIIKEIILHVAD